MRNIKPKQGQSLLDIAIEHCGDVAAALDICIDNKVSLTQIPTDRLQVRDAQQTKITQIFVANNFSPATGIEFPPPSIENFIIGESPISEL